MVLDGRHGAYWQIPVLIAALVAVAWFFARRRSGDGR
jgi:hypothetical protein